MQPKSLVIAATMLLSLLAGMLAQYFYPGQDFTPIDAWLIPVFALLVFLWFWCDTEQRSYKRSPWLNIGILAVSIIALPYYFFRSRGFKGGLLYTAIMLLLIVCSGLATLAGMSATHYALQR